MRLFLIVRERLNFVGLSAIARTRRQCGNADKNLLQ